MIKFEKRFDANAYRIADEILSASVQELKEGQWVTYDANGELIVASSSSVHAFIAMGSKRKGRNQVGGVPVKKIAFLYGPARLQTDQFDTTGYYGFPMTPLTVNDDGVLTNASASDKVYAYAAGAPVNGFLTIFIDGKIAAGKDFDEVAAPIFLMTAPDVGVVGNDITANNDLNTVVINAVALTALVTLSVEREVGQFIAVSGTDADKVSLQGDEANVTVYDIDTSGGSVAFIITVSEPGKIAAVYEVTVTIAS